MKLIPVAGTEIQNTKKLYITACSGSQYGKITVAGLPMRLYLKRIALLAV